MFSSICAKVDQSEHFISVNENSIGNDPDTKQPDCGMFGSHVFSFDKIYDENSDQSKVYDETGKDLVMSCLSGYNATILAYGQTGAGVCLYVFIHKYQAYIYYISV